MPDWGVESNASTRLRDEFAGGAPYSQMTPPLHSRFARVALLLVLLVATQLAWAGQLCRAVMVAAMPADHSAYATGDSASHAANDARPCCDRTLAPAVDCTIVGATSALDASLINAQSGGAAPPVHFISAMSAHEAPAGVVGPVPAAPAGHALPAFIQYHRFLS